MHPSTHLISCPIISYKLLYIDTKKEDTIHMDAGLFVISYRQNMIS